MARQDSLYDLSTDIVFILPSRPVDSAPVIARQEQVVGSGSGQKEVGKDERWIGPNRLLYSLFLSLSLPLIYLARSVPFHLFKFTGVVLKF